jgi:hypothetical protein
MGLNKPTGVFASDGLTVKADSRENVSIQCNILSLSRF